MGKNCSAYHIGHRAIFICINLTVPCQRTGSVQAGYVVVYRPLHFVNVPHTELGLGCYRLGLFDTGITDISNVFPFPRNHCNTEFLPTPHEKGPPKRAFFIGHHFWCRLFDSLRNSVGVSPVIALKVRLKLLRDLNPADALMASMVSFP